MRTIGIYNPYLESRGGGEKVCLALASVLSKNPSQKVSLVTHSSADLQSLEKYFNIDLTNVKLIVINFDRWYLKAMLKLPIMAGFKFLVIDLYGFKRLRALKLDVFINNYYQSNLPNIGRYGIYMCMFPQKINEKEENIRIIKRLYKKLLNYLRKILLYPNVKHGVYTYDKVVANSKFTQFHIKKYWDLPSDILYPICEDMLDKNIKKEKIILNVGRFFAFDNGSHHKRQDFLLDTFAKMKILHKDGWELHFAGSIAQDKKARKFAFGLKEKAKGLPIYFHFDASFHELKKLYNQSTIYWHATGYGSDPVQNPEKQEHFGISTVEAMSTGSVPIVINTAGQKESVTAGVNGFLWKDASEIKKYTTKVVSMSSSEYNKLKTNAMKSSKFFGIKAYEDQIRNLYK